MEYNYCRRCSKELKRINQDEYQCENNHSTFAAPIIGASLLLVDDDSNVHLVRRGREPDKGMLGSIGGFINVGETAEEAAMRETQEESGLTPDDYGPLHFIATSIHDYHYQGEARPVMSINFCAKLHNKNITMTPGDDAAAIEKIPIDQIDITQVHGGSASNGRVFERLSQQLKEMLRG